MQTHIELLAHKVRQPRAFTGLAFMVVAKCADCATFLSFIELQSASIYLGIEALITPLPWAAIGIFAADTRSFSHSTDRRITGSFTAFIVESARFAHRRRCRSRAESCFASACLTLLVLGTECTVTQLVFAGTFSRNWISTIVTRAAV